MIKLSSEAKVGLFVIIGVVLLVIMSLRVSGVKIGRGKAYEITVKFDNVAGLDKDAPVLIGGVEIGRVKDIILDDFKAKLILNIHPQAVIGDDFTAMIRTKGLLGEKYVALVPGSKDASPLEHGGEITRTATYTDPERLATQLSEIADDVKDVTKSLSKVLGGDKGEATLRNIFQNIETTMTNLNNTILTINKAVSKNEEKFGSLVENLEAFSHVLNKSGTRIAEKLETVSVNLDEVINENRVNLRDSLANLREASIKIQDTFDSLQRVAPEFEETFASLGSIAGKIDRGEGTIGKLVNDEETVDVLNETLTGLNNFVAKTEKFKTFVGFKSEFLVDSSEAKSFFSLTLRPTPNKFYFLEIIDNPRDRETFDKQAGTGDLDEIRYSIQIGGIFDNLTIRGGLIESAGGIGIDYSLLRDRLKLTFEASDFDADRGPYLKAGATYDVNRYFFITGGYDDFVSEQGLESVYLGLGIKFEDEDLRDLLMNAM
jgi:phospholipid/cholesterol/gamma-HCH transport system substrate-binding protein